MKLIRHNSKSRAGDVARKKEGLLPRRHSRLRQSLLTGAFLLALLPHSSAPTSASVRASGDIVATDRTFYLPATQGRDPSSPYTSSVVDAEQLFDRIGVHWIGKSEDARPEVRTSADGVSWTDWYTLDEDGDMVDADRGEHYAPVLAVPVSRYAQYRLPAPADDADAM